MIVNQLSNFIGRFSPSPGQAFRQPSGLGFEFLRHGPYERNLVKNSIGLVY